MPEVKSIGAKVIAIVFVILVVSLAAVLSYQISTATKLHIRQAIGKARAITAFCEQTRQFMGNIRNDGMFDDTRLLSEFEADRKAGKPYSDTKIYRSIPVVAAWTTARMKAGEMGYQFRVPRNSPRNPMNRPRPGIESSVVDYLEGTGSIEAIRKAGGRIIYPEKPSDAQASGEIGILFKGRETLNETESGGSKKVDEVRFFRAIRLSEDCLSCHGDPKGSKDLLGFNREGWKAGEIHGAFEIISPLAGLRSDIRGMIRANIVLMFIVLVIAGVVFVLMFRRILTRPMASIGGFLKRFGEGDLTGTLDIRSSDEIGVMAADLTSSVTSLRAMVRELSETTSLLGSASGGLSSISMEMAHAAEHMTGQADMVASAAERISASVATVASAGEESSSVVSNISAMTEEMSITFQDIARVARDVSAKVDEMAEMGRVMSGAVGDVSHAVEGMAAAFREVGKNTAHASTVSRNAADRFEDVNVRMEQLENASRQIGKVVGIIKDIADQTNMLALNAAIEAAGAGEAGKGFAVVAQEVKDLARQSADATDEIAAQVRNIQTGTQEGVASIHEISRIIGEIASINVEIESSMRERLDQTVTVMNTISTSVEMAKGVADNADEVSRMVGEIARSTGEASKVSVEVARNVDETAGGIREVARASSEASEGTVGVSRNMRGIRESSGQVADLAGNVSNSARELSGLSGTLSGLVRKFKI